MYNVSILFLSFQVFVVELSNPTGGARVGSMSQATLRVLANDNPHGTVALEDAVFSVSEEEGTYNASITVVRR